MPRVWVPVTARGGKPMSTAAAEEGAGEHNGMELLLGVWFPCQVVSRCVTFCSDACPRDWHPSDGGAGAGTTEYRIGGSQSDVMHTSTSTQHFNTNYREPTTIAIAHITQHHPTTTHGSYR